MLFNDMLSADLFGELMDTNKQVQANLPLTEVTYFILLSLVPGPRHGYAIMKDVRQMSNNRVVLSTGTLYGAIKRMLEQGWILRSDDPHDDNNGRERKFYRLTTLGRQIFEAEVERLDSLVVVANLRTADNNA
jgi:DNA-binding PadR family transcriptional regulator